MPFGPIAAAVGTAAGLGATGAALAGAAGAVVGAATGGIGGLINGSPSSAANNATNAQISAAQNATQLQGTVYNQQQANLAPYMAAGGQGLNAYQQALGLQPGGTGGINATGFQGSPGYQWQLQQGQQAIQNTAAAKGGVASGNTLKALTSYGQGLANQDWYNYLNQLSGLAGSGQNAAVNLGAAGQNYATAAGNNSLAIGNAQAQNYVTQSQIGQNQTNALLGPLTTLGNSVGNWINGSGSGSTYDPNAGATSYGPAGYTGGY